MKIKLGNSNDKFIIKRYQVLALLIGGWVTLAINLLFLNNSEVGHGYVIGIFLTVLLAALMSEKELVDVQHKET